ncbi:MAG: ThiJ/PfpI domain protein [Rickettsiaceae bacterium]|jgi:protease I|nr:ThiJ/PfpI domain protein [Rickettsiaceae bacterium]
MIFGKEENDNYLIAPIPERLRKNKRIAIITGDKVEDLEFFYPYYRFSEAGYEVDVITIDGGAFEGKKGLGLKNSKSIDEAVPDNYELLYLPGGKAPDDLRKNEKVLKFVRYMANSGKVIASICHGAQILIAADLVKGKEIAAWPEMRDEVEGAGAVFADEALKKDGQFITARKPGDLHRHLYGILERLNEQKE